MEYDTLSFLAIILIIELIKRNFTITVNDNHGLTKSVLSRGKIHSPDSRNQKKIGSDAIIWEPQLPCSSARSL